MVSSEAKTCPHCGAKLKKSIWRMPLIIILSIVGGLFLLQPFITKTQKEVRRTVEETHRILDEADTMLKGRWVPAAVEAEKYAKKSFKGTPIVYKKIGGVKKDLPSKDDYTVAVVVDSPDGNDRVLILEIKLFEDNYTIGWDTRSATTLTHWIEK